MENPKSPAIGMWCCVAASLLAVYVAAYSAFRWDGDLGYGVKYSIMLVDRGQTDFTTVEVVACRHDQSHGLRWEVRDVIGSCLELVFYPLCRVEGSLRQLLGRAGFGYPRSSIEYVITSEDEEFSGISLPDR
jgi:hypothetical protein